MEGLACNVEECDLELQTGLETASKEQESETIFFLFSSTQTGLVEGEKEA